MKSNEQIPTDPIKLADAVRAYEGLIEIYPDNENYLLHYAELSLAANKQATALEALQRLHSIFKESSPQKARQLAAKYPQLGEMGGNITDEANHQHLYPSLYKAFGKLWIILHQRTLNEGEYLYKQGEKGDSLSLVLKGELAAYIKDEHGNNTLLNLIEEHDIVGEGCFLTPGERAASIVANTKSTIVELPRQKLMTWFMQHPDIQTLLEKTADFRHILLLLSNNSILKSIPMNMRQFIAKEVKLLSYEAKSFVHKAGDKFDGISMVIKGNAHYIASNNGKNITLETITCGNLIGDASAVRHATSPADLVTTQGLTIAHIPTDIFTTVVAAYPPLKESLFRHSDLQRERIMFAISKQLSSNP